MFRRVFLILPIGVESEGIRRWPVVSAAIAGITILLFFATWVFSSAADPDLSAAAPAFEYWAGHPYLEVAPELKERLGVSEKKVEAYRAQAPVERPKDDEVVAREQEHLDGLCADALRSLPDVQGSLLRRLSLIPEKGAAQPGWLTNMFVHFGWMHLLGNLLFFYLTALLLEDRWGRPLFAAFYLAGGLVANLAQAAVMKDGSVPVLGASGAIAACMGAFVVNTPRLKIRMWYALFIFRILHGTFSMVAWLAGALWFLRELLSFATDDGSAGVAFMAHMGGFAFGAAVAGGIRALGIDRKYIARSVEGVEWETHPDVSRALDLLGNGEPKKALAVLERALKKTPEDTELLHVQAQVLARLDRADEAGRLARKLFARALTEKKPDDVTRVLNDFSEYLDASKFVPAQALGLAQQLIPQPEHGEINERLFEVAEKGPPAVRAKALLAHARLRHQRGARPEKVRELLNELGTGPMDAQLRADADALLAELGNVGIRNGRAIDLDLDGGDGSAFPPGLTTAALEALEPRALVLRPFPDSQRTELAYTAVKAIALAHVQQLDGRSNVLVIDLVLSAAEEYRPATVVRLPSHLLPLGRLVPSQPPLQAWQAIVRELLQRTRAPRMSLGAAANALPRFADGSALEQAAYGSELLRASA